MIPCTLFTSAGQILYKIGAESLSLQISSIIFNMPLIAGLLSYGIGLVFLIIALLEKLKKRLKILLERLQLKRNQRNEDCTVGNNLNDCMYFIYFCSPIIL